MRRRGRAAESAVVGLLLLVGTACGSRFPESDFGDGCDRTATRAAAEPVRVGIVTSATSPVGGDAFTGPRDGAADGLLLPVRFEQLPEPPRTRRTCLSVARWEDARGWVSQGDMNSECYDVPQLPYKP